MTRSFVVKWLFINILIHIGFSLWPTHFLWIYQNCIFPVFRIGYDSTFGLLPFPVVYLLVGVLLVIMGFKIKDLWAFRTAFKYRFYYVQIMEKSLLVGLFSLSLFYWVWGFHYFQKSNFPATINQNKLISEVYLKSEFLAVAKKLNTIKYFMTGDIVPYKDASKYNNLEKSIRIIQEKTLHDLGYTALGHVRVRYLLPQGTLLRWSTAGVYFPFIFEGHVDSGLHPIQIPFTLAHEMAHGYGITNEGDCNLIALIVCLKHKDIQVRYAGLFTYMRYLWSDPRMPVEWKKQLKDTLSKEVLSDWADIKEQSNKFPDLFPFWREVVYEAYLHWMGVDEGLDSYFSIVDKYAVLKTSNPEFSMDKFE
ncbi:MAG: DUF3810 family protein [Saprospiraceae bacterium]